MKHTSPIVYSQQTLLYRKMSSPKQPLSKKQRSMETLNDDQPDEKPVLVEVPHHAENEELKKEMAKMKEEMAKMDEQMAKKDEQIYKGSLLSTLFDERNCSAGTNIGALSYIGALSCTGTSFAHLHPHNHSKAIAQTRPFTVHQLRPALSNELKNFNFELDQKPSSYKGTAINTQKSFENESDVRMLLHTQLIDATAICNETIKELANAHEINAKLSLCTKSESRLFSNIIDIVVVYDEYSGTPILAVEAKKFLPEEDMEGALGQSLDQLLLMKLMGHPNPFGVLSCHNKTYITWLDSEPNHKKVKDNNDEGFAETRLIEIIKPLPLANNCHDALSQTPIKSTGSDNAVSTVSPDNSRSSAENDEKKKKRKICISPEFSCSMNVDVFVNVIFCSLHHFFVPRCVNTFEHGKSVQIKDAIGLTEKTYRWVNCSPIVYAGPLSRALFVSEKTNRDMWYLVSPIGRGATSKVFRAITKNGRDCVIKLIVQRRKSDKSIMNNAEFQKFSKDLADIEVSNYKAIYENDEVLNYVWRQTLNKLQCIIMPFFQPVQKEDRPKVMGAIGERLQQFKIAKKMFHENDQLWRHIGYFSDKLYLFDLGHLIDVKGTKKLNTTSINAHLGCLQKRADSPSMHL